MQSFGAYLFSQVKDGRDITFVPICNGEIYLEIKIAPQVFHAVHCRLEASWSAVLVMLFCCCPIQTDADSQDARSFQFFNHIWSYQRSIAGQRDTQAMGNGMLGKLKNIGPQQWLASAEDEHRPQWRYALDESFCLSRIKLIPIRSCMS
jgi:hypothetical protein